MTDKANTNVYLDGALSAVFAKTAMPIIIMMLVNGSFNLVDAYFLGIFVGAEALTAVTSMFPLFMLMVALSTLVSNGFASVMARLLGAGKLSEAKQTFAQAISLSLIVCGLLMSFFLLFGQQLTLAANNGNSELATMSINYMAILIYCSPLMFILTINSDSLRCEGFAGFIALVSLLTVLLNGTLNYLFIAILEYGVIGSAYGTVLAQFLALALVAGFRYSSRNRNALPIMQLSTNRSHWREFLTLGAPSSLNYLGVALTSAAVLYNLQHWVNADYATTVSAYGIITRLMTFVFLPLLGLSMAFQSITGNNVGAKQYQRTNHCIKIALVCALVYCVVIEVLLQLLNERLGALFVNDIAVINEVSRILPITTLALFLLGPLMMITMFFQSIGDAARASILGLSKTYLFALPLVFILPTVIGEQGVWYAGPMAEILALTLTLTVLYQRSRRHSYRLGLLYSDSE